MAQRDGKMEILHPGDHRVLYKLPEIETVKVSPTIFDFMINWENVDVIDDYLIRHSDADKIVLQDFLQYKPKYLHVAGLDLIYAKNTKTGVQEFLTIETNSCPGSFFAIPSYTRPYETLLLSSFFREEKWRMNKSEGRLAFLYRGTLELEALSIPHYMAEISQEKVYMLKCSSAVQNGAKFEVENSDVKFIDGVMYARDDKDWVPIRACFRWHGAGNWVQVPVKNMKTFIYPHPITCLATGRNKHLADLAYKRFNEEYKKHGLEIRTPKTLTGIEKKNMREIVGKEFGFRSVIKSPYESQARGIYVIRNESDVDTFLETDDSRYNLFVVQELIGIETDRNVKDEFIQVGASDVDANKYACSFRVTLCESGTKFKPFVLCGTKAPTPFICNNSNKAKNHYEDDSVYITNVGKNQVDNRYIPVDEDGMKRMGITVGDIVDAYLQSVMCMIAIYNICKDLMREDGSLDLELLKNLNPEEQLIREIEVGLKSELFNEI